MLSWHNSFDIFKYYNLNIILILLFINKKKFDYFRNYIYLQVIS